MATKYIYPINKENKTTLYVFKKTVSPQNELILRRLLIPLMAGLTVSGSIAESFYQPKTAVTA